MFGRPFRHFGGHSFLLLFREENFGQTGAPQAKTTAYRGPPKLECRPIQDRNRTVKRAVKDPILICISYFKDRGQDTC